MAVGHTWAAFSRSTGLLPSGPLPIVSAQGVLRHMGISAATLTTPFTPDAYGRLAPGCGVLLERDGVQRFSGIVGSDRRVTWSADATGQTAGQAVITVQLLDDRQHLVDRLVWPDPGSPPESQTVDYWQFTGPASTAMLKLIDQQAGLFSYTPRSNLGTPRRVPGLTTGTDPVVGTSRLWQEQWANLWDTLCAWSVLSGSDLGVRIATIGGGLLATIYVPRDLSAGVRFSANLTNLIGWDLGQQPPSVTLAIAAGSGDLHARLRQSYSTGAVGDLAWGRRIEQYIDQRQESNTATLLQVATDAVAQGIGTFSLALTPIDSTVTRWGVDYDLGDRVTAHVGLPGGTTVATVTDLVREIGFDVKGSGAEKITPAVGTMDAKAIRPGWTQQQIADVAAGLARLTRNK